MTTPAPASLSSIAEQVDHRIRELLSVERARWAAVDGDLTEPFDEIGRFVLGGGKRLRPAFCHWAFVGCGGDPGDPAIVDAGAAFELMHAFALFHDDVMDDANSRRGMPTIHARFAETHARRGWAGESRRFGEGIAILVGDLTFVYADQLLAGASAAVWSLWNELRIELNIGQYLDVLSAGRRLRSIERADKIARYKSGKYTIERPLQLGALLAGVEPADGRIEGLSAVGLPLGDAFQMRDDVLGAFGDSSVTGKPVGMDIREGKPTPLLARAYAAADEAERAVLDRVGLPEISDDDIASIQQVMVDTGALATIEYLIVDKTDAALAALDRVELLAEARAELTALAHFVTDRET